MGDRVHVEELSTDRPQTRLLKVTVTPEALDAGLRRVAREVSRHLNIPGFRPGRAPYRLVEQRVGRTYLVQEFLEREIEALIQEALRQADLEPAFPVELREVQLDPVSFELEVPLKPKVNLDDYLRVRAPYEPPTVTDEDVERYIWEELLRQDVEWEEVSDPAQFGDRVEVVLSARVGEKEIEDETSLTVELVVGEAFYLPGLVEEIVGMALGEEKTFTLPVPENHAWRSFGEEADFTVRVTKVLRRRVPELTPEMVKEVAPGMESPEELRQRVKEMLEQKARETYRKTYLDQVFAALKERGVDVEYPPILVERMVDRYIENLRRYANDIGTTYEQLLQSLGKTEEQLRQEVEPNIRESLWRAFVVSEVLAQHKPEIRPEDMEQVALEYVEEHAIPASALEQLLLQDEAFRQDFVERAYSRRGEELLIAIARGEWQPEAEAEEEAKEAAEEGTGETAPAATAEETASSEGGVSVSKPSEEQDATEEVKEP